jgi:uncharacterized protein (DUF1697 family)
VGGTHIALLRGINVGPAKRVAMADLRRLVEDLGFRDVRTLLNSGNVVFSAPGEAAGVAAGEAAARIEKALVGRLGVSSRVTALTPGELAGVVAGNSLAAIADNPSRLFVAFFADAAASAALKPLLAHDWAPEALAGGERAAYLWCPDGFIASRLREAVDRALGDAVTTRTWATVTRLNDLAAG